MIGRNLEVSIPSVRSGDGLSHWGLAREIGVILGYKVSYPLMVPKLNQARTDFRVEVKEEKLCRRYILSAWLGVSIKGSDGQVQKRLRESGMRPINGAVDLMNYIMLETGQPMHAFDADKIAGRVIQVRLAEKGEEFVSLEGKKYVLDEGTLVVADKLGPLALAGIKGGKRAEVTSSTKNMLVESANFCPRTTRKTSRSLALKTDASWRFENGIDSSLAETAQKRLVVLGEKTLKPNRVGQVADVAAERPKNKIISLDLTWVRQVLGAAVTTAQIKKMFAGLGLRTKIISKRKIRVVVPSWRLDINISEDLAEEIGRLYGYDRIRAELPRSLLIPPKMDYSLVWRRNIKNLMTHFGLSESYHYSFLKKQDISCFGYDLQKAIEIANPVSAHYQYLRFSLLPNLLQAVKENAKRFDRVEMFEIGKTFSRPEQENLILAGAIFESGRGADKFYQMKGIIEALLEKTGITDGWLDDYQAKDYFGGSRTWHPHNRAEIKIGSKVIGFLGEIHPRLADEISLPENVFAFEIDLDKLIRSASEQQEYQPISPYPAVIRDISIVVPTEENIEQVIHQISLAGDERIRDVDLIDIYQGANSDEKSLTLRVVYQSGEKNLTSTEVNQIQEKINRLCREQDWTIR